MQLKCAPGKPSYCSSLSLSFRLRISNKDAWSPDQLLEYYERSEISETLEYTDLIICLCKKVQSYDKSLFRAVHQLPTPIHCALGEHLTNGSVT
jgi:hypothetical protein